MISLDSENYSPKFSGHETFPLRYGWLKKAYDALINTSNNPFKEDSSIAHFGVGKNMLAAIQHWGEAVGTIEVISSRNDKGEVKKDINNSTLGNFLLSDNGADPYLENPDSLWLLHWNVANKSTYTTWHWVFNYLNAREFTKEQLIQSLIGLEKEFSWKKSTSVSTIKRDVDCFIRTYCPKKQSKNEGAEDAIESTLVELQLIGQTDTREKFRLNYGDKVTLSNEMLAYCIIDFWSKSEQSDSMTISIGKLAFAPGSPGRVFLMDEDTLARRIEDITTSSNKLMQWSETAGLKQLIRNEVFSSSAKEALLSKLFSGK